MNKSATNIKNAALAEIVSKIKTRIAYLTSTDNTEFYHVDDVISNKIVNNIVTELNSVKTTVELILQEDVAVQIAEKRCDEVDFTVRCLNSLKSAGITMMSELSQMSSQDLQQLNFNNRSIVEIFTMLERLDELPL